jgi:hypothetical protein
MSQDTMLANRRNAAKPIVAMPRKDAIFSVDEPWDDMTRRWRTDAECRDVSETQMTPIEASERRVQRL